MKKYFNIQLIFICILLFAISCQKNNEDQAKGLASFSPDTLKLAGDLIQQLIDSGKYTGIYTLVEKDGEIIENKSYGFSDVEQQKVYDENTIVRIFSMTKPVTAVALMILFDEGKIGLDDKVSKFIPEFGQVEVYNDEMKSLEPLKEAMTIRHLLTHTSGISYGWNPDSYVDSLYRASGAGGWDGTIAEKMEILSQMPLNFQPGSEWEYGLSIDVAGYIVEIISGMSLDEFFQTRIFDPLKMDDTGFYIPEEDHDRFVPVYTYGQEGSIIEMEGPMSNVFLNPVTMFSGGGGLVSTMNDYLLFCRMLLNKGELDGVRILDESTVDLIMSDQLPNGLKYSEGAGHGLAGVVQYESGTYAWGGMASTNFWIDPTNKMIIITFTQLIPTTNSYAMRYKDIVYRSIID